MRDFLFTDDNTGWVFFVETDTLEHAYDVVNDNFGILYTMENIWLYGIYTEDQAELLGYDTL